MRYVILIKMIQIENIGFRSGGLEATTCRVCPAREVSVVHSHVLEQVQPTDVDTLACHGDGCVLHILEEGRTRRKVPHLVARVVPLIKERVVHVGAGGGGIVGVVNGGSGRGGSEGLAARVWEVTCAKIEGGGGDVVGLR